MSTEAWGILFAVLAVYFFYAAMCRSAAMQEPKPEPKPEPKQPEPLPEPFIAWRITGTGEVPDTIALEMNEPGEQCVQTGQFHWEE